MKERTTNIIYKPSQFTHYVNCETGIILYNSLYGEKSIKKYSNNYKNVIINFLKEDRIIYETNPILDSLIENNYIVSADCDELLILKNIYVKCTNSSILHLVILPTEQCNFRCRYCYESFERGRMSQETIDAIIKYVRINISRYTGLKVSWFGGEPSLEIDTICKMSKEFIKICKMAKRKYWANITSNGYLINLENFKRLYSANVFTYQLTIDGIETTHNQQRILGNGQGSFEQIIANLLSIKNNMECRHWKITIRTNFSKPIYEQLDEYISFYSNKFGDDKRFSFLFRPAGNWGGESVKSYEDNLLQAEGLSEVYQGMLRNKKILDISRHLSFLNPGGSMCLASGLNTYLIDSGGTIRKCSCHLDDNRNVVGKVMADGTFMIDQYRNSEWIQERWQVDKCINCFFLPTCLNASCPANYILQRGDTDKCHVYEKEYINQILAMVEKQGLIAEERI